MSFKVLLLDSVDPVCGEVFAARGIQADQPGKLTEEELFEKIGVDVVVQGGAIFG